MSQGSHSAVASVIVTTTVSVGALVLSYFILDSLIWPCGISWLQYLKKGRDKGKSGRLIFGKADRRDLGQSRNPPANKIEGFSSFISPSVEEGILGTIGNTPLIRISSLSEATGCEILGKAEFFNPGGSVKDRVALQIIREAFESGALKKGGLVTEGSAGSTGVSLALVSAAVGCQCFVALPDDAAKEKSELLKALGAEVQQVRPVSITHRDHYVNVARRRAAVAQAALLTRDAELHPVPDAVSGAAISSLSGQVTVGVKDVSYDGNCPSKEALPDAVTATKGVGQAGNSCNVNGDRNKDEFRGAEYFVKSKDSAQRSASADESSKKAGSQGGFFADQFENLANFRAHYGGTAPEIWQQTCGKIDAFVAGAGTGGTLSGISTYLKDRDASIKCFLIDPPGSSLFNRVTRGVLYSHEEAEGKRLRNPFDTIMEGVGINRLTANFELARLDGAFRATDREAVEMSRFLLKEDGLFLGSSSALNCIGAVRIARMLGPGHTIVTILCDGGHRHLTKFHNPEYLEKLGLSPVASGLEFLDSPPPGPAPGSSVGGNKSSVRLRPDYGTSVF